MSELAKKIKLKPGSKAAIIHAPGNYLQELQHDTEISSSLRGKFDWIQIFVKNKGELDALAPRAVKALKLGSILWITFPKGTSKVQTDLTRDMGWEEVQKLGLKWINLVSIDETGPRSRCGLTGKARNSSRFDKKYPSLCVMLQALRSLLPNSVSTLQ